MTRKPQIWCTLARCVDSTRNSIRNRRDVTIQTAADLAKTRKSQVTFAPFNAAKITSVQPAQAGKVLLAPAQFFPGNSDPPAKL
jgi:hypothetical protein